MSQPYCNDKVWISPSQLLMCSRVKTALREREACGVFAVACL